MSALQILAAIVLTAWVASLALQSHGSPSHTAKESTASSESTQNEPKSVLRWLESYNGESTDQLIALRTIYDITSINLAFEQAIDQKAYRIGEDNLTLEERTVLAIEALDREVNNGGYGQFFVNSSRQYADMIVDALQRIGCHKTAEITLRALKIVQKSPITENEMKFGTWEENETRQPELDICDNLYFARVESIDDHLFSFIVEKRKQIALLNGIGPLHEQ